MPRLEENLELCKDAVAYAKGQAVRSGNQSYFKTTSPGKEKKRYTFLLGMTRTVDLKNIAGRMQTDATAEHRRRLVEQLMRSGRPKAERNRQLDDWVQQWGEDYFWGGYNIWQLQGWIEQNGINMMADLVEKYFDRGAYLGASAGTQQLTWELTTMYECINQAKQSGVGNCGEKAGLVAEYLIAHADGGRSLGKCHVDPEHYGYTGKISKFFSDTKARVTKKPKDDDVGKGDHAFCVYDAVMESENVGDWGDTAVIADGWMNDAYPAQHHLKWKYGKTYRDERINIKQLTIRNMICVSYKKNIIFDFYFMPNRGPLFGHVGMDAGVADTRESMRNTPQYETIVG